MSEIIDLSLDQTRFLSQISADFRCGESPAPQESTDDSDRRVNLPLLPSTSYSIPPYTGSTISTHNAETGLLPTHSMHSPLHNGSSFAYLAPLNSTLRHSSLLLHNTHRTPRFSTTLRAFTTDATTSGQFLPPFLSKTLYKTPNVWNKTPKLGEYSRGQTSSVSYRSIMHFMWR